MRGDFLPFWWEERKMNKNLIKFGKNICVYCNFEVDPEIKLGGDGQTNRVETDEMDKGHRQKGIHGHRGVVLANIWAARGIDPRDMRKKWLLMP